MGERSIEATVLGYQGREERQSGVNPVVVHAPAQRSKTRQHEWLRKYVIASVPSTEACAKYRVHCYHYTMMGMLLEAASLMTSKNTNAGMFFLFLCLGDRANNT